MKLRLQRILSILCILALAAGCLVLPALAEEDLESRIIIVKWEDEDNIEGIRPDEFPAKINNTEYNLDADSEWTGAASVPATGDFSWSYGVPAGYTEAVGSPSTSGNVTTVTFKHTVEKTEKAVQVVWAGEKALVEAVRPKSVDVVLLADGNPCRPAETVDAESGWAFTWGNLPATKDGVLVEYTARLLNDSIDGFTTNAEGLTITNTVKTGELSLNVTLSGYPEGADLSGLKLTVKGPDPRAPWELTYADVAGGVVDFGNVLVGPYIIEDENASTLLDGYAMDSASSKVADAVYVQSGEPSELNFKYTWKETEEEEENENPSENIGNLSIEILGPEGYKNTITYADFTDGKKTLDNLVPGTYAVIERNAEGLVRAYTLVSDGSTTGMILTVDAEGNGITTAKLYNKYEPAPTPTPDAEFVDIPVTKIWNDNDNKDGNRPASVTVNLYANGVLNETRTITAADGWTTTFLQKPRYDDSRNEITYTVNEEPVAWYTSSVNGYFITNTYQPEVTSASVVKVWDDNDNERNIRPTSIAVTLRPTGEVFVLNEANGWSVVRNDLPTKINGEAVTYSWSEQEVVGYVKTGEDISGTATVFTNRAPEVPTVPETEAQPQVPTTGWVIFEEYNTALGGDVIINHVGDCFD